MNVPDPQQVCAWPTPAACQERARILFLSCHLPWPPLSGGRRRELELITRLGPDFDIHLVVVSKTPEADLANAEALWDSCREVEVFAAEPAGGRDAALHPGHPAQPVQVDRHRSPAATRRVSEIIAAGGVALVHVEGFYLMQHVPDSTRVPVLLVEQNIEYDLERQRAATGADRGARLDLFSRWRRTRASEIECWRAATRLAAVTPEDRAMIETELVGTPVAVVPDGADHLPEPGAASAGRERVERPAAPVIALLANFGYAPNVDAAQHLCRDILPLLRASVPEVHTWLVGNDPPVEVKALAQETVTVTGRVPDILPYLDAADVMVCPLRIGGGIKVKTIEALRRGKAIVSTPIGAQGLGADSRRALLVAEEPAAFAHAVASLLEDRERRLSLERRAMQAASHLPRWATRPLPSRRSTTTSSNPSAPSAEPRRGDRHEQGTRAHHRRGRIHRLACGRLPARAGIPGARARPPHTPGPSALHPARVPGR